jgi:hypothetical protein
MNASPSPAVASLPSADRSAPRTPCASRADDSLRLVRVLDRGDLERFVRVAWTIYRDDPHWVPPIIAAQVAKLDTARDPFWREAERALWIAYRGTTALGTIAAIVDHARNRARGERVGAFGFFECVDDARVARALVEQARAWLRERGMTAMHGPYNPSVNEAIGVLVEGHDTRPALLEGHHPGYYAGLLEACGLTKLRDSLAWLVVAPPEVHTATALLPEKLFASAARARARPEVRTRRLDVAAWSREIATAHELFNTSLATVPDFVPVPADEFNAVAESFRGFIDPDLTQIGRAHV